MNYENIFCFLIQSFSKVSVENCIFLKILKLFFTEKTLTTQWSVSFDWPKCTRNKSDLNFHSLCLELFCLNFKTSQIAPNHKVFFRKIQPPWRLLYPQLNCCVGFPLNTFSSPPVCFARERKNVSWRSFKTLWHTLTFFFNFSGNIYIHSLRLSAYFDIFCAGTSVRPQWRSFIYLVRSNRLEPRFSFPRPQHFHGLLSRKIFTPPKVQK